MDRSQRDGDAASSGSKKRPPPPPPKKSTLRARSVQGSVTEKSYSWKPSRDPGSESQEPGTPPSENARNNHSPEFDDRVQPPKLSGTLFYNRSDLVYGDGSDYPRQYTSQSRPGVSSAYQGSEYSGESRIELGEEFYPTRIGFQYEEYGRTNIRDYARYTKPIPRIEQLTREYDIVAREEKGGNKPERLDLISPYLKRVFMEVVKYYPEATNRKDKISFPAPFAPLYFYYDEMVRFVQQDPGASTEPQKMEPLKQFYSNFLAADHDAVREALKDGSVTFNHLWALFRPGELLYALDEFEEPRLYVIAETGYSDWSSWLKKDEEDGGKDVKELNFFLPGFQQNRARFHITTWYVHWNGSKRKFIRKFRRMNMKFFDAARDVTSLDFYPLSMYKDRNPDEIQKLRLSLEQRGNIWKSLICEPPSCWYHDGPVRRAKGHFVKKEDRRAENLPIKNQWVSYVSLILCYRC